MGHFNLPAIRLRSPLKERSLIGAGSLAWFVLVGVRQDYRADDAFILFRHVANHARGIGMVWDTWHPVQGFSSPAWAWLLRLGLQLHVEVVQSATFLGLAFAVVATMVSYSILRRSNARARATLLVTPLILFVPVPFWAFAGLEADLVYAYTAVFIFLLSALEDKQVSWALVLLAFVSAFVRPDLPIQLIGSVLVLALLDYVTRRPVQLRAMITVSVPALAGIAVSLTLNWFAYGESLALPSLAKSRFELANIFGAARYVVFHAPELVVIGLALIAMGVREWRTILKNDASRVALALLLIHTGEIVAIGGDELACGRMLIIPAMCLVLVLSPMVGTGKTYTRPLNRMVAGVIFVTIAALNVVHAWQRDDSRACSTWRQAAGLWLKEHASNRFTIAVLPAGVVPYYSGLPTIDLLGLAHPRIATIRGVRRGSREWGKRAAAIALEENVCTFVLATCDTDVPCSEGRHNPVILGIADALKYNHHFELGTANIGGDKPLVMAVRQSCKEMLNGDVRWDPLPWAETQVANERQSGTATN